MENLFAENFPGLFTVATNVDYMLAEIGGSSFTAEHLCCVVILNPFQESRKKS